MVHSVRSPLELIVHSKNKDDRVVVYLSGMQGLIQDICIRFFFVFFCYCWGKGVGGGEQPTILRSTLLAANGFWGPPQENLVPLRLLQGF